MNHDIQSRAKEVRHAHREYLEWARSLLTLAETTSIAESPTEAVVLRNVFRLQILYNERESLRVEYCFRKYPSEIASFRSLSDLNDRLLKNWTDDDESGIRSENSNYAAVLQGIDDLEGKTDSPDLDKPFRMLSKNPNYRKARLAFAERIKKLNDQLG